MTSRRSIALSGTWVLVIVTPLLLIVLWLAVSYAKNASDNSAERLARSLALKSYEGQVKACKRGNILREASNQTTKSLVAFLHTARIARLAAVKTATNAADRKLNADAAAAYKILIEKSTLVPIVDCRKAYVHP